MEFDHADIFKDFGEIKSSFRKFVRLIPPDGNLVVCSDWPAAMDVAKDAYCPVTTYALDTKADWRASGIRIGPSFTQFSAKRRDGLDLDIRIGLPGRHNVLNSLAVIALCDCLGLDLVRAASGLSSYEGVKRRQEIMGEVNDIIVIDDFAHHPRAVSETLLALRERFKGRRLVAVFEPRTNTSRRAIFQKDYAEAFDHADKIMVRAVPDPEKAPEGDRFSSERLVHDLRLRGKSAEFCVDASMIIERIIRDAKPMDVYVILSNGPFESIHERLLDRLRHAFGVKD